MRRRRPTAVTAMLCLAAAPAVAAVHGVPQQPRPGPPAWAWATLENDFLADRILNADDHRTGGGQAGLALPIWTWMPVAGYDYAALTRRESAPGEKSRSDEQSAALGIARGGGIGSFYGSLAAGVGLRLAGRYGGAVIQNALHSRISDQPLDLPYEPARRQGYAWVLAEGALRLRHPGCAGLFAGALDLRGAASLAPTTDGGVPWDAGLRLVGAGRQGTWWLGGRYLGLDRRGMSQAAIATAQHEAGWWVGAGMAAFSSTSGLSLTYGAEVNPGTGATAGSVGVDWRLPPCDDPGPRDVRQSFAYGDGTRGFAVQLVLPIAGGEGRWWAAGFVNEWRWGVAEGYDLGDREVQADQLAGGLEGRVQTPAGTWIAADLCLQALIGCRAERITSLAAAEGGEIAYRPAGQVALRSHLGTDSGWRGVRWINRLRPGLGVRWSAPWYPARTADGTAYQLPRAGLDWELAFVSAW